MSVTSAAAAQMPPAPNPALLKHSVKRLIVATLGTAAFACACIWGALDGRDPSLSGRHRGLVHLLGSSGVSLLMWIGAAALLYVTFCYARLIARASVPALHAADDGLHVSALFRHRVIGWTDIQGVHLEARRFGWKTVLMLYVRMPRSRDLVVTLGTIAGGRRNIERWLITNSWRWL